MRATKVTETILFSILFLFFLQSLSDFIEAIYAFGLLVTAFTIEIASVVLLFTPLLLLLLRKRPMRSFLLGLAYLAILARLLEPVLNPGGKLVACGFSVGAFMLLFPLLIHGRTQVSGWRAASGLVIALSLSIFFRTANSSLDLSESGPFQIISWFLGILAGSLLWRTELLSANDLPASRANSGGRLTGLAIGLASVILIIYFAFASPTVVARWTGYSYPAIVMTLLIVLTIFGSLLGSERFSARLTRGVILGWNILFLLMLVLTILPHQIAFPSRPEAYPIAAPAVSPLAAVLLFLMLILSPILFINFMLLARQISAEKPSLHQLGGSFSAAALFFLIMVFFHVFTTIYDYAPVIGPVFRERFWLVYLLAGLGMELPLLLLRKESFMLGEPERVTPFTPFVLGALALFSILGLYLTAARPAPVPGSSPLKIMTYNIQQGFDAKGNANLMGQLAVIKSVDPDVLGVQESDSARIANGNVDAVRFFADNLDMYSYYGPTTTTGTFGIALLSKYSIQNPTTFFMYSTGEQTAAIQAQIDKDGQTYQVFVTHLGNGGPIVQLQDLLTRLPGHQNVIAMGDFNFEPTTDQYALITQTLADAWLLKWPNGKETPGVSSASRIDHIFVSHEINVLESEYVANPASDHPYMYVIIEP
ncbi:MAG TPA: endonuclease/exonuclease/phosphatase family protein [Anaerolineales bacterium]|nr:endonuclease/exonuclease/phosphatase family protein [Anaerolineales bacterium]